MRFPCSIIFLSVLGAGFIISGFMNMEGDNFVSFFCGIFLLSCAFYIYNKLCTKTKASEEYLNDKNDGLYWVKTQLDKEFYKIEINTNERTIALEADGKSKVYHFSEITNFGYDKGTTDFANGKVLVNFQTTKYYIKTTDPLAPVWYFKFLVDGSPSLEGINYVNKLEKMYEKWHQILNITLNKGVH